MSILWSHRRRAAGTDERGSALIGVLLLLMIMTALAAALGVNGQTETLISRNQRSAAQAQAAAEAGLNHATELATTYIFQWKDNGFASAEAAIDALLWGPDGDKDTTADNTSLGARLGPNGEIAIDAAAAIPLGTRLTIADGVNAWYEAYIMDDDATAPDEPAGDLYDDENETLIVVATGYAQDGLKESEVVLEARLAPAPLPAVVADGDLFLSGNVEINGARGSVHANGDMQIQGNVRVTGTATASGAYSSTEDDIAGSGGAAPVPLTEVRASDYLTYADFVLTSAGTMTQDGVEVCPSTPCNNWNFNSGTGEWSINGSSAPEAGTYYVEGGARINGSPGSPGDPMQVTIIAEGSIRISGSPDIIPDTSELLFVTDGDLEITGSIETHGPGQILVHEQIRLFGTPDLDVQILVENATSVDSLAVVNSLSGNVEITYNGGLGTEVFVVSGWRDLRDDD